MSGGSEAAAAASSLPIIKVHVMLPGGSSIENDTYVSIKYSKGTTAEEVISHVSKKKVQLHPASPHSLTFLQQLPALRFELVYLPSGDYTPSCVKSDSIVLSGPAIISDIVSKVLRSIDASSNCVSSLTALLQVAVQGRGLWWLRETHEDSMARLVYAFDCALVRVLSCLHLIRFDAVLCRFAVIHLMLRKATPATRPLWLPCVLRLYPKMRMERTHLPFSKMQIWCPR